MGWRYHSPPGWPTPPAEWTPPPGWKPDPSWPPAPEGWQFWTSTGVGNSSDDPTSADGTTGDDATGGGRPVSSASAADSAPEPGQSFSPPPPPPSYPAADHGAPRHRLWWALVLAFVAVLMLCLDVGPGSILAGRRFAAYQRHAAPAVQGTPAPTDTMTSTPTSTAEPTASTSASALPPPPDQTFEGQGAKVIMLNLGETFHIANLSHQGESNFTVTTVDAAGTDIELLVNAVGDYKGVRPLDFGGVNPAAVKIDADGSWKMVVQALEKAPTWSGDQEGRGAQVLLVAPEMTAGGLTTVTLSHRGEGNFVVSAYADTMTMLVNKVGQYAGETVLPPGTAVVVIDADGTWTFKKT